MSGKGFVSRILNVKQVGNGMILILLNFWNISEDGI